MATSVTHIVHTSKDNFKKQGKTNDTHQEKSDKEFPHIGIH